MPENSLPNIPETLPVVATSNLVVYPFMLAPLTVGRESSLKAMDAALAADRLVALTLQKDEEIETPTADDLHPMGCVCAVVRMNRTPDGNAQVIVQGLVRAELSNTHTDENGVMRTSIRALPDSTEKPMELQAHMNSLLDSFSKIVELSPVLPDEALMAAQSQNDPGKLADFVASTLNVEPSVRQGVLEELDVAKRIDRVSALAADELNVLELTAQISSETRKELDKGQREFILRQQLAEIQKQLGEDDSDSQQLAELRQQVEDAKMPEEAAKAAQRELKRLERIPSASPEYSVTRNYLDYLIAVPWSKSTEDNLDIGNAKQILNEDHYDLVDAKDRILEYLAVRKLNPEGKGPILCFVGPPGVGKTSLAHSIARALGRKFVRMALGGVRDEAEIRGHRRTYIGSLPGRIVQGLRDAGTNNPVMILDEIDKLGSDYRGDPTSALLEVLDPQQNNTFKDHYLEVSVDLSQVMFITTANVLDTIPEPLRDRMEILHLPGYTEEEKMHIARQYLLPRQIKENGLRESNISISDKMLRLVIHEYTFEAGVRNLERELGTICRKTARKIAENHSAKGTSKKTTITAKVLEEYLGAPKHQHEMAYKESQVGVVTGMAWTPRGGEILFIEAVRMPGKGGLTLTGQLGDVMKESARIALDYLRSHGDEVGIPDTCDDDCNIHIHVPAGAIPKDGPSAGVAMTCALASLLSGRKARHDVSMTGEVTLTGRVLPIGGVKEKSLAAYQAGITTIILPERNKADLREIPEEIRDAIHFEFVSDVRQAIEKVLLPPGETGKTKRITARR
jgi:ATP-dependent Lon protease